MDAARQLIEIEAIKQLKFRYQRGVDLHDWNLLVECFAEDATCAYADGEYSFTGRDAIVAFLRGMDRDSLRSSHQVHQPEITLTSDVTATGVWALHDTVIDTENDFYFEGAGYYFDEYVKHDGTWKIAHTGYRRLWEHHQRDHTRSGWRLGKP